LNYAADNGDLPGIERLSQQTSTNDKDVSDEESHCKLNLIDSLQCMLQSALALINDIHSRNPPGRFLHKDRYALRWNLMSTSLREKRVKMALRCHKPLTKCVANHNHQVVLPSPVHLRSVEQNTETYRETRQTDLSQYDITSGECLTTFPKVNVEPSKPFTRIPLDEISSSDGGARSYPDSHVETRQTDLNQHANTSGECHTTCPKVNVEPSKPITCISLPPDEISSSQVEVRFCYFLLKDCYYVIPNFIQFSLLV